MELFGNSLPLDIFSSGIFSFQVQNIKPNLKNQNNTGGKKILNVRTQVFSNNSAVEDLRKITSPEGSLNSRIKI